MGDTPRIIQTFMENYDLKGKKMILCGNTLKSYSGINWISGKRFTGRESDEEYKNWIL